MKVMRYHGFAQRIITAEDWSSVGVKSKEIDVVSGNVIEISDEASAWLLENESADWQEATEKELKQAEKEEQAE